MGQSGLQGRVENDLAFHFAGFDEPMCLGGVRQRQNRFDLSLDLALRGSSKALRHVRWMRAGTALDGDLLMIKMSKIDGDLWAGMSTGRDEPAAEPERLEGL